MGSGVVTSTDNSGKIVALNIAASEHVPLSTVYVNEAGPGGAAIGLKSESVKPGVAEVQLPPRTSVKNQSCPGTWHISSGILLEVILIPASTFTVVDEETEQNSSGRKVTSNRPLTGEGEQPRVFVDAPTAIGRPYAGHVGLQLDCPQILTERQGLPQISGHRLGHLDSHRI